MYDSDSWHFDVLPFRPPPYPDECLSGYLLRLADANGFPTLWSFAQCLFPHWPDPQRLIVLRWEYPVCNWEDVLQRTQQPAEVLASLTVLPLVQKLRGLDFTAQPVHNPGRLLRGLVTPHLKVCPLCLKDAPYIRLMWRFADVTVCERHRCQLVDRCQQCGQLLASAHSQQRHLLCARCQTDLRSLRIQSAHHRTLAPALTAQARHVVGLQILLDPDVQLFEPAASETAPGDRPTATQTARQTISLSQAIGFKFRYLRHLAQISAASMAQKAQVSKDIILGIEAGRPVRPSQYLVCLDALGTAWSDFAHLAVPEAFIQALAQVRHLELRVCPEAGCIHAQVPAVRGVMLLADLPHRQVARFHCYACGRNFTRAYSGELVVKSCGVDPTRRMKPKPGHEVAQLTKMALRGDPQKTIAQTLGWDSATVRHFMITSGIRDQAKLAQAAQRKALKHRLRIGQEKQLLSQVNAVLKRLCRRDSEFHVRDVIRELNRSDYDLHKFPNVITHVVTSAQRHNAWIRRQRQHGIKQQLLHKVRSMPQRTKLTSASTLAGELGVSLKQLRAWCHDIWPQVEQAIQRHQACWRQARDQALRKQVDEAARHLLARGMRLSGPVIVQEAGLSRYIISSPQVREALRRWIGGFAPHD